MQTAHWLSVTLFSIGDAVIATDTERRITFMNPVAEALTGWTAEEALGVPLEEVFIIVNQHTRESVESPVDKALREGVIVGLANHTLLIAKDGAELPIDDSAAPIRDDAGEVAGVVLVFRDISERYRHEQDLRGALEYATNILSTLREPFLVLDRDLRVVSANDAFYRTFRTSKEETEGRLIYDLGSRQWDIPALRELLEDLLPRNHEFKNSEVTRDFPEIGLKAMILNARRVRTPGNHSELILLAIEDVTERRATEVAFAESERRYRQVVNQVRDYAIFSTDPQGRATTWNEGVRRILGFDEGEFIGTDVTRTIFTPEAVEEGVPEKELETAASEGVADNTRWMRRKNGEHFFAAGVTTAVKGEAGDVVGFTKVLRDVTENHALSEARDVSETRYRRLFESAKDGILILDAETMLIIDANPFMSELLGYTPEQFQGKALWEIGLFRDRSASEAAVRTLRQEGYLRYEDLPLAGKDGNVQEVEIIGNVYREDHRPVAQCNIRDITERKRMERQIEGQARTLAEAGRRKDEFLAMLSHELRNPMAPIFNALHVMGLQKDENALQRKARGIMERQVRHLSRLVDDLLEVSRITTGRIRLHFERVDLTGIARRAVERVEPLIARREQHLALALPDAPVWLHADATRLEQAIGNLLDNASKYNTSGGHVWLTVETPDGADGSTAHALLRVRDDGIGMAPDVRPRVFDLFTQADKSLDRSEGGLGIGLALVKSLVELHRGTVEALSDGLQQGSEFVVQLPLADGEAAPPDPAQAHPTMIAEGLRVLVVDDSQDAATMSAMLLRAWGHEVRVAHDGPAALERAAGFHPHVILLDIGLPGMDGYEVARHVRQNPLLKDARLVAVTGYGQDGDRRRSEEAGFDVHLTKPVDPAALKDLLAGIRVPTP